MLLRTEARARRRGETVQPALILGAGKVGRLTARRLLAEPELGLRPIGFLDADPLEAESGSVPLPVFGAIPELQRVIEEQDVQHVIVTFSKAPHDVLLDAVRRCRQLGVSVSILPRLFEVEGDRATVERLGSLPLVSVAASNPRGLSIKAKYATERAFAAFGAAADTAVARDRRGRRQADDGRARVLPPAPRRRGRPPVRDAEAAHDEGRS